MFFYPASCRFVLAALWVPPGPWLWVAGGVVATAMIVLLWAYWRTPGGRVVQNLGFFLKLLGITALAFCLLGPMWTGESARPGANLLVVMADNSRSMTIADRGSSTRRGDALRALLDEGEGGWIESLAGSFQVRRYLFDARPHRVDRFAEPPFDGRASALGASLKALAERYRGRPLAGVVLFTDGNATDLSGGAGEGWDAADLPPIYPVVPGGDLPRRDLALGALTVSRTAFEDAPVALRAAGRARGYAGRTLVARLLDEDGEAVARQTRRAAGDDAEFSFRFRVRPQRPGVSFYRVRLSAEGEPAGESSEATLANNTAAAAVERRSEPHRILYVGGRPSWEYKFLRRAVAGDDQIELVGLIRVAGREPKFTFRGHAGETGNPLFRGFDGREPGGAPRYDQPVLIRLNTEDAAELRGGFPAAAEDLYGYDAVVLDGVEAGFFAHEQMSLLGRYVGERGGGFLMLGGRGAFMDGGYARTPISRLLPVYLDRPPRGAAAEGVRLDLTRAGWLQPWVRLRDNERAERERLAGMPAFRVLSRVGAVKPGAEVIATATDDRGRQWPALAAQRFGEGRAAALMVGDLWRWGLGGSKKHEDMDRAWRQMLRWLVADVPRRITLRVERRSAGPGRPVVLRVRARDRSFEPLDDAAVSVSVRAPDGRSVRLRAEPSLREPGLFEATYLPRESGGYRAEARVEDAGGGHVGGAEAGWVEDFAAEEFRSLRPDRPLLERIAARTGGRVVEPGDLAAFAADLPRRAAPIRERWARPLWHTPALFLFALACFVAEWGLRRWGGMP